MATPSVTCPRCRYDLSGSVAAWEDACPLRGVCSECGYDFDWGRALARASGAELALYEVAMSLAPYALVRSIALAFRPAVLWREAIRGEPLQFRRLAVILGLGILTSHLLITLAFQIAAVTARATGVLPWQTREELLELVLTYPVHPMAIAVLYMNILLCPIMLIATQVVDDDRFRPVDVARAYAYWFASVPLLAGAAALLALIDLRPVALQFGGGMRSTAREMGPVIRVLLLASLYGWAWYWWATAFKRYFRIPHPIWRSFMATGGWFAVTAVLLTFILALTDL